MNNEVLQTQPAFQKLLTSKYHKHNRFVSYTAANKDSPMDEGILFPGHQERTRDTHPHAQTFTVKLN